MRTMHAPSVLLALALPLGPAVQAQPTTAAQLLADYSAQVGAAASAARGQAFFNRSFGRDFDNCAACHGAVPNRPGKDLVSEKPIAAMAPAAAPATRFADKAKTEYLWRLNCRDVVGRECSAQEKADVMSWLVSLPKP